MMILISFLLWIFYGFVTGNAFIVLLLYLAFPMARRPVRLHVVLLAYSYSIFCSTSTLHILGIWPHDEMAQTIIGHYGTPGWIMLLSAGVAGVVGLVLALQAIAARLQVTGMNSNE